MSEQKKFNLLRYVYGELFLCSLGRTVGTIKIESWKLRTWVNILRWLEAKKHISALHIQYVRPSQHRISYIFNYNNIIYPQYLKYLQRMAE